MCNCSCDESDRCNPCGLCPAPKPHVTECDACDEPCGVEEEHSCALYVAVDKEDSGKKYDEIAKFEPSGVLLSYLKSKSAFEAPRGIVFDRLNNLYIGTGNTGAEAGSVIKVKAGSKEISVQPLPAGADIREVETDDCGNVYAADNENGKVYTITCDGQACAAKDVTSAWGLAYDNASKTLYVSSELSGQITAFSDKIDPLAGLTNISGAALLGLALDSNNVLYAAAYNTNKIYKITSNASEFEAPSACIFANLSFSPDYIAFDMFDNLYVRNRDDDSIVKINKQGFLSSLGKIKGSQGLAAKKPNH